ncbi:MAG: hypothetical protein ACRDGT_12195 [Candidatus Limnocylindria bacterium]
MLEHVKWFTDPAAHPTQYGLLLTWPVLLAFATGLMGIALAYWIQHNIPEPALVRLLERFAGSGPLALGLHIGVALLVAATLGLLFVPSLQVRPDDPLGAPILTMEAVAGVSILLGLATRAGAVILALLGIVAMQPFTFEAILEQVHILGIAVFLFLIGRGPLSFDRMRGVRPPVRDPQVPAAALTLLRVLMGFGIAYTALTEKLLNPSLSQALLDAHPLLNVLRPVGVPDPAFIWLAGTTELAIGLVIVSGQITRPVMAVGAALFTISLFYFGWLELLGHLPFFGIMLLLLIAPSADTWRAREALRPAS